MSIAAGSAVLASDMLVALTAAGAFRDHAHQGVAGDGGVVIALNIVVHTTATTAPSGWTEYTAGRGRVIVGTPASGTMGGTVGTALTNLQDPTHNHQGTVHNHDLTTTSTSPAAGNAGSGLANNSTYTTTLAGIGVTGSTAANTPYVQLLGLLKS